MRKKYKKKTYSKKEKRSFWNGFYKGRSYKVTKSSIFGISGSKRKIKNSSQFESAFESHFDI